MDRNLTPKLRALKEEYDFLHGKIGELEWELATIFYDRRAILSGESDNLRDMLENYRKNMSILIDNIRNKVENHNKSKIKSIEK